jgi:hypothetical protein
MADPKPQNQKKSDARLPASSTPQDYHAILMKVIDDVTHDQALLRKLVYALAWHNLKPEDIIARPIPEAQTQAKNIFELEQALQFERAIERIEVDAIEQGRKQISRPRSSDQPHSMQSPQTERAAIFQPADDVSPAALADGVPVSGLDPDPPARAAQGLNSQHLDAQDLTSQHLDAQDLNSQHLDARDLGARDLGARDLDAQDLNAPFEPPNAVNAIIPLPEQRSWPERKDVVHLERIPSWLDPSVRVSLDSVEYAPIPRPSQSRSHFISFFQLIAASVIGVVLYIGISGWVYLGRQSTVPAPVSAPPQPAASSPGGSENAPQANQAQAQAPLARPAPEPQSLLPFPLPKSYGVFAGSPGQLFELEPLPIKVPDPRVLVSAEITKPSNVTTPGENLAFVIFRRDLVNSAPQTVTVRVVARVQRATKFVGGEPAIVPLEGIWRIRSKAYDFKVSPLEGRGEMVVIQPHSGFVFAPGRYALVLNGVGYDFTVAGAVTAPEQCLEQVEVVNGVALSECPKT